MRSLSAIFVAVLLCGISISCNKRREETPPDISEAVKAIQEYTNSFEGLTMEEARKRVAPAAASEEPWDDAGVIDGTMITVEYDRYTLLLMCHDGSVIAASVQFLTD